MAEVESLEEMPVFPPLLRVREVQVLSLAMAVPPAYVVPFPLEFLGLFVPLFLLSCSFSWTPLEERGAAVGGR